jgi:hypothetical protein
MLQFAPRFRRVFAARPAGWNDYASTRETRPAVVRTSAHDGHVDRRARSAARHGRAAVEAELFA